MILIGSFLVIYCFNFIIPRLMPGDPFDYASSDVAEDMNIEISMEQKEYLRAYYGMDKPLAQQFAETVKNNLTGDYGLSMHFKRPAVDILAERLPWTLYIMVSTLLISLIVGSFFALWCVRSEKADKILFGISSFVTETPPYLIGILLLFLIAAKVSWLPLSGAETPFAVYDGWIDRMGDVLLHGALPILAMCIVTIPKFFFTARASFLSIAEKPYLLNAKAKGLKEKRIRWRYIFVNGITPVIARFFLSVGGVVGGTMLIENVFAYPGLGTVMREAVKYRDYVLIQDVFLLSTVIVLISLFAADMLNEFVDKEGQK